MANPVSEARPTLFSNWGDDAPDFGTKFLEPPSGLQQNAWDFQNFPPAEYENWLNWITQRWIKNLDVRAPRIPIMKWFVGAQSGAHFATLTAAMASSDVQNGDWIFFSPSNANSLLSAAITINKSVKIFFEPYCTFVKSNVAATRALIITAADVHLYGAEFSNGWDDAGDVVIETTGARTRIVGCKFDAASTRYIKDNTLADADKPILVGNSPDSLLDEQTKDLWSWETGREQVDSIAAATNDLVWTKAFSATVTWAARIPAASVANRYFELMWMFAEGITLKIVDGSGAVWLIVPKSNASFETYVTVAGEAAVSDYKLNLLSTGIGVVYDVYKNGAAVANFSTFSSVSSGSMDANTFRAVLYGDRAKPTSINGRLVEAALPKRRWIKLLSGDVFSGGEILSTDVVGYRAGFVKGKQYRFTLNVFASVAATSILIRFFNHFSTTTVAKEVLYAEFRVGNGVPELFHANHLFTAYEDDFSFKTSATWTIDSSPFTTDNHLTYMIAEGRFWPQLVIEET